MYTPGPKDAIDPRAVRRALVTKLRHHGDVLLASPVFSALRRFAPHAELDALVYEETAPMLANHPAIHEVYTVDRQWKKAPPWKQAHAEWALLRKLLSRHYDLLVHLTEHRRGAWLSRVLRPRHSVAPTRRDDGRLWQGSFSHLHPLPREGRPRHAVEVNLDALRRLGIQPDDADKPLVLVPGPAAETRVEALCREHGLADRGFVVIHPGSRWMFKALPPSRIADIVALLCARGTRVVLTGAPDAQERSYLGAVLEHVRDPVVDLSGALTLPALAALIARAEVFIGVDSAPMHIAAATGTPVIAFFGPSSEQAWGPWRVAHRVLASRVHACRPCGHDGCGGGKVSECLAALAPERVVAELDTLLAATGTASTTQ